MYSKFNCVISENFYNQNINRYCDTGRNLYEHFQQQSRDCLKAFLLDSGHIDGTALKNHWFRATEADIFISHSHQDVDKAIAIAGWLKEEFGLTAFIDSCVWGYSDDLLKLIDEKYCKHSDGKTFDYQLRNYTTSHVHTMLSAALLEMIDKTECLLFYNTPHSICLKNELEKVSNGEKTLSPWIYYELSTANSIKPRKPTRIIPLRESFVQRDPRMMYFITKPQFEYDVQAIINGMPTLNDDLLKKWQSQHIKNNNALDDLYKLISPHK